MPPLGGSTPLRWLVQVLPSPGRLAGAVAGAVAGRLAGSPLTVLAGAVAGRLVLENKRVTYCPHRRKALSVRRSSCESESTGLHSTLP